MFLFTTIILTVIVFIAIISAALHAIDLDIESKRALAATLSTIPDFTPDFKYISPSSQIGIAIDSTNNMFSVSSSSCTPKVFNYTDIIDVQIVRNSEVIYKTNRGNQIAGAALGTLLLGPVGLLLGGVTGSKRSEEKVQQLSLRLSVRDLSRPTIDVPFFFNSKGLKSADPSVKSAVREIEDWHTRFLTLMSHDTVAARPE
jgi:hypothetical protein